jgi:hypothetical protein
MRSNVRYDKAEGEFLLRCPSCAAAGQTRSYWPITREFWDPRSGLAKCRACHNTAKRLARRQTAEELRAKQKAYYWEHRDHRLKWRKAYHQLHKDEINRLRREKYAAAKAKP